MTQDAGDSDGIMTFSELAADCERRKGIAEPATRTGFYNGGRRLSVEEFAMRFQLACARDNEDVVFHTGERIAFDKALAICRQAQNGYEIGDIQCRYGQWVVDDEFASCLAAPWYFAKRRDIESDPSDWKRHVCGKTWAEPNNWIMTVDWCVDNPSRRQKPRDGRERRNVSSSRRYKVLVRDGCQCQICGARASDGAQLHVDHRMPLARGGSNDEDNLWTLCAACNLGKHTDIFVFPAPDNGARHAM